MQVSFLDILALVSAYAVFGFLGFRVSKRFKRPVSLATWITLIVVTFAVACYLLGPNSFLVSVFGFNIYINSSLQAIGVGIIIGLATREIRLKVEGKNTA